MHVVVTYDIADNKRRYRVFRAMKGFGKHVQFSVFECRTDPKKLVSMVQEIVKLIKPSEDSIRVYPLCEDCRVKSIVKGCGLAIGMPDVLIV